MASSLKQKTPAVRSVPCTVQPVDWQATAGDRLSARVSDDTAFFYLGRLVEYDTTERLFTTPREQRTEEYVTGRFG